ncbi:hypothetical protein WOSG25_130440 [Weissella oryzae SG25]|uniref:Uncharacterized protein n=1 Tax=Weissella oryzae (strain DSM 25784 / JCM 18191 / LMG 30913 / SG25) TaxID=1329250 RepID=A0A069CWD5_WEIOS|nr:hypothetical protein WOSG25_130440 [Weissella oryzae SG25]
MALALAVLAAKVAVWANEAKVASFGLAWANELAVLAAWAATLATPAAELAAELTLATITAVLAAANNWFVLSPVNGSPMVKVDVNVPPAYLLKSTDLKVNKFEVPLPLASKVTEIAIVATAVLTPAALVAYKVAVPVWVDEA